MTTFLQSTRYRERGERFLTGGGQKHSCPVTLDVAAGLHIIAELHCTALGVASQCLYLQGKER